MFVYLHFDDKGDEKEMLHNFFRVQVVEKLGQSSTIDILVKTSCA